MPAYSDDNNTTLPRLFVQIFISLCSPHLRDSIAHGFVRNGSIFIELCSIYYTSSQNHLF
jgi:hypothetical protein